MRFSRKNTASPVNLLFLTGIVLLLSLLLAGCGSGAGSINNAGVASVAMATAQGRATFTVHWPNASRLIPLAANSIQVRVLSTDSTRLLGNGLLTPPSAGGVSTLTIDSLPVGPALVKAAAYPNPDGTGVAQAQAQTGVTVVQGQTVIVPLTLASTIDHIEVKPSPAPSLTVGSSVQLTATAKSVAGEVVLISDTNLQWRSLDTTKATVSASGQVTGIAPGNTSIQVTETESGKQALVTINVQAALLGELYVSNFGSYDIKVFDAASGKYLRTFIPHGAGGLSEPHKILFGSDGLVYISSDALNGVLRFRADTGAFVDTFIGTGANGGMDNACGMLFDRSGNLLVCSAWTGQVKRFNGTTGAFLGDFLSGNGLNVPHDLFFGPDGKLYVCSDYSNEIKRYDPDTGAFLNNFIPAGSGGLDHPTCMVFAADGTLYVSSYGNSSIKRYNSTTGAVIGDFVPSGSGGLSGPIGLAFGPDGNLYVASYLNDSVKRYDGKTGAYLGDLDPGHESGVSLPWGLTFR